MKQPSIVPWDDQKPRDNVVYCLSETLNLREEDYEIRQKFNKDRVIRKQSMIKKQSFYSSNANGNTKYSIKTDN